MEWPPSTPTRLATLPSWKACRMPASTAQREWASGRQVRPGLRGELNPTEGPAAPSPRLGTRAGAGLGPTFAAGDAQEGLRVQLAHALDNVDLLQRPPHGVLVLGVAGRVRRPELGGTGTATGTSGPGPTPRTRTSVSCSPPGLEAVPAAWGPIGDPSKDPRPHGARRHAAAGEGPHLGQDLRGEGGPRHRQGQRPLAYLAPDKPGLQLGDVGVRVCQGGQVGPRGQQLVVEAGQQLPGQVVVPAGRSGREAGWAGAWTWGPRAPSLAPSAPPPLVTLRTLRTEARVTTAPYANTPGAGELLSGAPPLGQVTQLRALHG